jgi:hypothetical protein
MRHEFRMGINGGGKRYDLLEDVLFELLVPREAVLRRRIVAAQTFGIQTVDTIQLDRAAFDWRAQRVDQPPVLVIEKAALSCREDDYPGPAVPEYE